MSKVKNQTPDYQPETNQAFIPDANYNSTTPIVNVPPESTGTTVSTDNASFMDDVAQYMKADTAELLRVRNQAMRPDFDPSNPPLIGRQDSDPKGG